MRQQLAAPAPAAIEAQIEERYARIPESLRASLLTFQQEGVRVGLSRGGRLLLADEVGVSKTRQGLALATAYAHEGPVLITCPASLRLMWAEQAQRWWQSLMPRNCTVVLGMASLPELDDLPRRGDPLPAAPAAPRVVITSYHMLKLSDLSVKWSAVAWGCVIVDESHTLRTTNKQESAQTQVAVQVIKDAPHAILLSGTPALNRPYDLFCQVDALWPGLLGSKEDFARGYCERRYDKAYKRFVNSGGNRLDELHLLLSCTVMLRREKKEVADDLPPLSRHVVLLETPAVWNVEGFAAMRPEHQLGWRKVKAACEWLREAVLCDDKRKVVIFAYHKRIVDYIESNLLAKRLVTNTNDAADHNGFPYVTIRGKDDAVLRQAAVDGFKHAHVRVALLSLKAAGTGLDFSSADCVAFVELPRDASDLVQAEARVHRRGVAGAHRPLLTRFHNSR